MIQTLTPPPTRTADVWAEQCRFLPDDVAEPGQWRNRRVPYIVRPLRALAKPRVRRVIFVSSAQVSKTNGIGLNAIGARLDDDPCNVIVLCPSKDAAVELFEPQLEGMIRTTPSLRVKAGRGHANKKTHKKIAGRNLRLAWAGSAVQVASMAAPLVVVEEPDRITPLKGEGDPISLAGARGATFPGAKMVLSCSPTLGAVETFVDPVSGREHWAVGDPEEIQSYSWQAWQNGSRYEWAWPCLECGTWFVPRLRHLRWEKDATPERAEATARLVCPACKAELDDSCRLELNDRADYLAPGQTVTPDGEIVGAPPATRDESFWVSGLASPWKSWGDRAADYVEAVRSGDPAKIQPAINTGFGECFSIAGKAIPWQDLRRLCFGYQAGEVPEDVDYLVASIDVQMLRIIWQVTGWSRSGLRPYVIEVGETWANGTVDTDPIVFEVIKGLQDRTYDGRPIAKLLIDSGAFTTWVYEVGRRLFSGDRCRVTKGEETGPKPFWPSAQDLSHRGKVLQNGMKLWHLNTDFFKSFVHRNMRWEPEKSGAWRMPIDIPDWYLQHLVAENRVTFPSGRPKWIRIKKENHGLDTAAMAVAGAYMLALHVNQPPPPPPSPKDPAPAPLSLSNPSARPTPPARFHGRPARIRFGGR